jgi:hypothetical protein
MATRSSDLGWLVAAKLAAEHPEMSSRAIAQAAGVSDTTVWRARAGASNEAPDPDAKVVNSYHVR